MSFRHHLRIKLHKNLTFFSIIWESQLIPENFEVLEYIFTYSGSWGKMIPENRIICKWFLFNKNSVTSSECWSIKITLRKWNYFMITKKYAADPEKRVINKINLRAVWSHEFIPTAWESNFNSEKYIFL